MKKAQIAMEFLITYGWALMIALGAIGYLSYAFLANPTNIVPDTCQFTEGVICDDFNIIATTGTLTMSVESAVGATIRVTQVDCKTEGKPLVTNNPNVDVPVGSTVNINCAMGTFNPGDKINAEVTITYIPTGLGLTLPKATTTSVVATAQ